MLHLAFHARSRDAAPSVAAPAAWLGWTRSRRFSPDRPSCRALGSLQVLFLWEELLRPGPALPSHLSAGGCLGGPPSREWPQVFLQ